MPIKAGTGEKPEVSEEEIYYLSSGVLGGKQVKPGDTLMLKVVEVGDGEIGVAYGDMPMGKGMEDSEAGDDAMLKEAFGSKTY
jgi:hypothetical protein